jgi:predicted NUDIX family NTP pyrophosphohydrolase
MTTSAGLVLFRERDDGVLEVLLGHMGGPFWARKDAGAWSIPKGELEPGEEPRAAALREFAEELGQAAPGGDLLELGEIRQKAGKRVIGFAVEGDFDPDALVPGTFEMAWPPRSGRMHPSPRSTASRGSISTPPRRRSCAGRPSCSSAWRRRAAAERDQALRLGSVSREAHGAQGAELCLGAIHFLARQKGRCRQNWEPDGICSCAAARRSESSTRRAAGLIREIRLDAGFACTANLALQGK